MERIEVTLVNSFTDNGTGGNSAGVVFNADKLSNTQKLKIAQAVGFSETAFVSEDNEADFEVSFFTTTSEVDFCGHATLAAFSTMYQKAIIPVGNYVQRTKAGMLAVCIDPNGKIVMEQQLPQKLRDFSYQEISDVLGIEVDILERTTLPIEVISTGLPDVIIPVPLGFLDKIKPNDHNIAEFCRKHKVVGFHVFELYEQQNTLTASCRNFAPLFGISEESATGTSNGALACYLAEHLDIGCDYVFEQGRAMNCTSIITASVQIEESQVIDVRVGGFADVIDTVEISI
ncbi:PhzF family phenazine biosynthesis protein [Pseudoalteromonas sp. MMG013]|uniref:Trans-2,3-dihydro-3-hydroxyanthranilate isomerase n=1 Tax=Pseudoalteromonas aurantia 208 TaxID=1314867 RepID=A0ABR9EKW5_9GAMM|nr:MULTISPECIES: PhzF family phenazine biosynthesis protein [Pseudoalteromonas]MBE0370368.1 trans-2,3-dihydro-3-hydroxyanthranilate isomerase [Pseudoalteromonas aurantia 208]MBQ4864109.1 PhzF family phenazine biosynthesis protein [Pseudoalteromonas sp. MMG013]